MRIHRNLNHGEPWVLTCKAHGRRRVPSVVLRVESVKVSMATLDRIRTPKGQRTTSGAQGLGKRTVGAWLVGEVVDLDDMTPTGATIHFNPFKDDAFQVCDGGDFADFIPCGQVVRFNENGTVEVME